MNAIWFRKFQGRMFAPADLLPLACFRIFFGAMMLYHVFSYVNYGWVKGFYVLPPFHFTYPGFGWVKPWPGQGMYFHFAVMGVAAFGIMAGCLYRCSAVVFAICFTHVFLIEKATYQNHYYLICLISGIMVFVPAHRMLSIDAWRKPRMRSQTVPQLWLWLLRVQLAITYFYGGIAKINYDWLHGMPMRSWLEERTWLPGIGPWLTHETAVLFFAWGGLVFDLLVVPALLWRRTRLAAYLFSVAFHVANSFLWEIGIFPWFMIGATLMFFPADTIRRTVSRRRVRKMNDSETSIVLDRGQRLTVTAVGVYLTWQLLFPFRHFIYPGDVSWTEEGHHFAWHMMLREKSVGIRFLIQDEVARKRGFLNVDGILHERQLSRMGKDPDMILDFVHFIRDQRRSHGENEVEIRALALASLNGRKPQLLMDPTIDYAAVDRVWGTQPWIVPLREPLPTAGWDIPQSQWADALRDLIPEDMRSPGKLK